MFIGGNRGVRRVSPSVIVVSFLLLCFLINPSASRKHRKRNFLVTKTLPDGEIETIVHYKKITSRERIAGTYSNVSSDFSLHPSQGYVLRQITDGRHFLQLIFNNDMKLWDCDYITDEESVKRFLKETRHPPGDRTILTGLTPRLVELTSYRTLKKRCKKLHRMMKKRLKYKNKKRKEDERTRVKRGVFIYPGTNFCGVGSANMNKTTSRSDICCRDHDHCPYMIEGWTTKFNLFNYRFHTLSHCHCDERFKACLKQINSSTANMIGYLFFNVVKMKCFHFKREKVCAKRSWWGTCSKYENTITAALKNPSVY